MKYPVITGKHVTGKRLIGCFLLVLLSAPLFAETSGTRMSDQQRLLRLERLLSADKLREQASAMKALREEIAALRARVEQQGNEIRNLKQRQRNLYQDMDRRIHAIEVRGSGSGVASPVPPPNATGAELDEAQSKAAKKEYKVAFGLLKEGKYKESIKAFKDFVKKFPTSEFADNAQYWLGQANYRSRKYKQALKDFEDLIARFPDSPKVADARLKVGYVYFELKNWSAARDALNDVVKRYPDSTVAKKAQVRIERIDREGH